MGCQVPQFKINKGYLQYTSNFERYLKTIITIFMPIKGRGSYCVNEQSHWHLDLQMKDCINFVYDSKRFND